MDVEAAARRTLENRGRQDQPISDDHRQFGLESEEIGLGVEVAQRKRMAHLDPKAFGGSLDGGFALRLAPAGRARRLAIHGRYLVARLVQRGQRRHRELGRAHEDDPHCHPS